MADWIKMRSSLLTNPKVVRMARVLLEDQEFVDWLCPERGAVTRNESVTKRHVPAVTRIVVGALLPTWSAVNDSAADDGIIRHATVQDIDETAGVPGFGKALVAVDWMQKLPDDTGVQFINFDEHNTPQKERTLTAKSGAERAAACRERKRLKELEAAGGADAAGNGVTKPSRDASRKSNVLGEKRGLEKKNTGAKAPTSPGKLPTCPCEQLVDIFHEVLPTLPRVQILKDNRRRALRKMWDWVLTSHRQDGTRRAQNAIEAAEWFRDYFTRANANDFLMGKTPRAGEHAGWKCDIDFLLTEKGMRQVIEKTAAVAE